MSYEMRKFLQHRYLRWGVTFVIMLWLEATYHL